MGRAHEVRKAAMAKTAAKKTKLYSYYGKEIYLAAKAGGPEPDGNLSLRRLIEKAKKDQVPGDVIKRAIDKVKNGAVEDYESVQFEGFGPSGSTVIVKCLTDNINRTISQVRPAFTKSKAKLPDVEFDVDEIQTKPQETVELEGEDMVLFERLMNLLNDCDDVDQVYHNVSNYDDGEEE